METEVIKNARLNRIYQLEKPLVRKDAIIVPETKWNDICCKVKTKKKYGIDEFKSDN
jgi:hypothetical protein